MVSKTTFNYKNLGKCFQSTYQQSTSYYRQ